MPKSYLREWRKFRNLTQRDVLNRLAILNDAAIPSTEASLSRLENDKQQYSQRVLEALAHVYETDPSSLIGRNPLKEGDVIDMVALLNDRQKSQAMAIIRALLNEANGTTG